MIPAWSSIALAAQRTNFSHHQVVKYDFKMEVRLWPS